MQSHCAFARPVVLLALIIALPPGLAIARRYMRALYLSGRKEEESLSLYIL
jgi:hypothetical protein